VRLLDIQETLGGAYLGHLLIVGQRAPTDSGHLNGTGTKRAHHNHKQPFATNSNTLQPNTRKPLHRRTFRR